MPRVCSSSAFNATRARTMPSSPRQPISATIASMLMATNNSMSVKPAIAGDKRYADVVLTAMRYYLHHLDDLLLRCATVDHIDFDPAEIGIRCGQYVLIAQQWKFSLWASKATIADCRPLRRKANLHQAIFG